MAAGRRRFMTSASAGLLLLGAGPACATPADGARLSDTDMWLGSTRARVTVIEYASLACHFCAAFHRDIWPELKRNYIDTGKIRFVFREFPTGQPQIASAEHLLARCMASTPDQYFKAVDVFFEQQGAIFQAAQGGQIREKLLSIAQTGGLSEARFNQCIADPDQIARLNTVAENADKQFKINGTPTIIINGEVIANTPEAPYTYEMLAAHIDAKLK